MDFMYFKNEFYVFVELRFDGKAIQRLKSPGRLIPIISPVTSPFSVPAILRHGKRKVKVSM